MVHPESEQIWDVFGLPIPICGGLIFFLDILNGETKNGRVLNLRHSVFSKVGAIKTLGNLCSSLEATMGKI